MESRIMQVFYGNDCLPYKDSARSVHYPIVGNSFIGASNTTQIRFYVRDIGGVNNVSWVAISKLPNGKIGNEVLSSIHLDSELNEYYVALDLSSYYTQLKGDVYISLNGYQGGVQVEEDEDTGIYTIVGTPIIEATGSIKLAINYAPQLPLGQHFNISDIQQMLGLISEKANIVNTVQVVADISQEDLSGYDDGQLFYDISTKSYYEKDLSVESPYYVLADKIGLLGSQHTLPRYVVQPLDFIAELEEKVGQDIFFVFSIDEEKEYLAKFIDTGSTYGELFAFTFDENNNLTLLRYAVDSNLDDFGDFREYATETKYVQMTENPSVVYATTDESQQTTIVYGYGIESETIVQRDGNGQINVPNTPTTNSHATSKKYVDDNVATLNQAIQSIKENAFILVDTTTYTTLQNFLDNYPNPQEGYIYLYPINTSDLSKGYYQYIWEGSSWLDIGTTQIDLSDYYTKTQADDRFVRYSGGTKDVNLGNHSLTANHLYIRPQNSTGYKDLTFYKGGSYTTDGRIRVAANGNSMTFYASGYSYQVQTGSSTYDEIATQNYVTTVVDTMGDTKVDKSSEHNKVYGTDNSGNQKLFNVDNTVGADGNIVRRASGTSQIMVPLIPTANGHASSKKYVDDSIANAISNVYKIKGSATVSQINAMTNQQVGDVYNITDSGTIVLGDLQVFTGDNIVWTGSAWDKLGAEIDWTAYDEKFIAAGFFEVQPYNENTGEITFVYSTELYIMSYDSDTGIMTIQAN